MSTLPKLEPTDGNLYVGGELLVYAYPMGDVDLIPWPRSPDKPAKEWTGQLACALFDAREMGYWDGNAVQLPDGTEFHPDDHLEDYEPPSAEGWLY